MASLSVFALSSVLLLSLSGVYHLLAPGTAGRQVLQRLDHAAIFVLIAGSFTPVHAILFRGAWRWAMLAGIWAAAITGLVLKTVFFATLPEWLGLLMYLGLGWMGVISALALAGRYRLVTPVSGAVVLDSQAEMDDLAGSDPNQAQVPTVPEPETWALLALVALLLLYAVRARRRLPPAGTLGAIQ